MNEPVTQRRRSAWKRLRRIMMWFFGLLILFIASLLTLLFVYEDEVKQAIISELNKHLKAEVRIDPKDIDLTIIKTFPDCSIQFKNALVLEALPVKQRDTLIFAGQLNLLFNIKDLWHKKYAIQKIRLRNGVLKPRVLADGKNNYTIWESVPSSNKQDTSKLKFNLDLLQLENCRLDYRDKQSLLRVQLLIEDLGFKGDFDASDYDCQSEAKLWVNSIKHKNVTWLQNKDCRYTLELSVTNDRYTLKKGALYINKLGFELSGGFRYKDSLSQLAINYSATKLDIASLLSLLPAQYKNKTGDYESAGNFFVSGKFNYNSQRDFLLESDFGVKNGNITYKPGSTTIDNVNIDGRIKFGNNSSLLTLKNIYLKLKGDELRGSGLVRDFSEPYILFSGSTNLDLANLQAFWPIDTLSRLQGKLNIETEVEGLLRDLQQQTFSPKVKLDVKASVNNFEAQFKNDEHVISIESGSVTALNRELEVQDLKLKRGKSDVLLNGRLPGFFNYLSDPAMPLNISGNLSSNYIQLEDFMLKYEASGGESSLIPGNVNFKLNAVIGKFTYSKFSATGIKGEIEVKNKKAIVSDMALTTMDGSATIDAFADNSGNRLNVVLQSRLKNINISQLFTQFNNFGQTTLQDHNIKGYASADIEFSGSWSNKLDCDLKSIRSTCNLNVERGELIDFKPLVSLSKFVDLEDLKHIKFSTLKSDVKISNQVITFPKTLLENSALNIIFSGTHSFDNIIDYHIRLYISELLAKKRPPDEEFGPVEEDKEKRWGAYIRMTGPLDNPTKKYDRKGHREKIKEDIAQEKQEVKQILKEKFGLFKKEELPQQEKRTQQKFELEKPDNNPPKKTLEVKKKPAEEDF